MERIVSAENTSFGMAARVRVCASSGDTPRDSLPDLLRLKCIYEPSQLFPPVTQDQDRHHIGTIDVVHRTINALDVGELALSGILILQLVDDLLSRGAPDGCPTGPDGDKNGAIAMIRQWIAVDCADVRR